jgi:hypothetical protein
MPPSKHTTRSKRLFVMKSGRTCYKDFVSHCQARSGSRRIRGTSRFCLAKWSSRKMQGFQLSSTATSLNNIVKDTFIPEMERSTFEGDAIPVPKSLPWFVPVVARTSRTRTLFLRPSCSGFLAGWHGKFLYHGSI